MLSSSDLTSSNPAIAFIETLSFPSDPASAFPLTVIVILNATSDPVFTDWLALRSTATPVTAEEEYVIND